MFNGVDKWGAISNAKAARKKWETQVPDGEVSFRHVENTKDVFLMNDRFGENDVAFGGIKSKPRESFKFVKKVFESNG